MLLNIPFYSTLHILKGTSTASQLLSTIKKRSDVDSSAVQYWVVIFISGLAVTLSIVEPPEQLK